jgi:dihydrofolate synthase/folylpolyglutamate synthase
MREPTIEPDPVAWLYGLQRFGIKLGLDNVRALLGRLDHPEREYPSLLVSGTNGKGSVAAMLSAMLEATGIRSGLFTSPHLVRPNERIRIGGTDISTPELDRHLDSLRQLIERGLGSGSREVHPSFFEVVTATALAAFRESRVGAAVLEVGLGGRLDATNAVASDVSVIVTLALDHVRTLGPTVEHIAAEKAGIVKPGKPLVTGVDHPGALEVLRRACREASAPLLEATSLARLEEEGNGSFRLRTPHGDYPRLRLPLAGRHQRLNARVAVVALEAFLQALDRRPDPEPVREGLASVRWPGRLQWVPGEPPLLLDGAHNPSGAEALAAFLRERTEARPSHRPVLLFGAMSDKDVDGILGALAGLVDGAVLTRARVDRAADPEELLGPATRWLGRAEVVADPARALARARERAGGRGYVLVAGSLYLVGEVLGLLEGEPVPGPVPM